MPSNFDGFDVLIDNGNGSTTPVPGATVKVYDVDGAAALPDLAADVSGHVGGGVLAVDPGTRVRFSVQRADGLCGFAEAVTT